MSVILRVLGYGWALLGIAGCVVGTSSVTQSAAGPLTDVETIGVGLGATVYLLLFIFPGLVVGALGSILAKRAPKAEG